MRSIFSLLFVVLSYQSTLAASKIFVQGRGQDNSYCNANSGSFCLNRVKMQASNDAERDARWTCEQNHRGRSLTFTTQISTYCNPNYLPPQHNGTWVNCRAEARMQCEIN